MECVNTMQENKKMLHKPPVLRITIDGRNPRFFSTINALEKFTFVKVITFKWAKPAGFAAVRWSHKHQFRLFLRKLLV